MFDLPADLGSSSVLGFLNRYSAVLVTAARARFDKPRRVAELMKHKILTPTGSMVLGLAKRLPKLPDQPFTVYPSLSYYESSRNRSMWNDTGDVF